MRLKNNVDAPAAALSSRGECSANLSGMVAVVVHDRDAAGCAALLEAPIDTAKIGKAFGNLFRLDSKLPRDGYGRGRVQHIVPARNVQLERTERTSGRVYLKARKAASLPRDRTDLCAARLFRRAWHFSKIDKFQPVVGLFSHAVRENAPAHTRQNSLEQRIVDAGRDSAVKRHAIHKIQKRPLHVGHV